MSERVRVMVFMPVGVCACSQTAFLGRVYQAMRKYIDCIDYQEYSAGSEVAKRYKIQYRGVVVGEKLLGSNPTQSSIEEAILGEIGRLGIEIES